MVAAFAAAPVLAGVLVASTVVSAGVGIFSAVRSAQAASEQREAEQQREQQLVIQGQQRANQILEEEIATLAAINVGAAAGNVDPFTGTPSSVSRRVRERANRQLSTLRLESEFGLSASQSRQRQLRLQGQGSLISGFGQAAGSVASGTTSLAGI